MTCVLGPDGSYVESPVHGAFGLTYASYFVAPRSVLERMPLEWQEQFVKLVEQIPDTGHTYTVKLRDERGRFIKDRLAAYRRPDKEALDALFAGRMYSAAEEIHP